ncbi:serine hydrolase domain-containing protein [Rhodococcus coprophilus]|uniref:Putative esterase n=1 Tax=Rhodococcus coprophilus TaxID=38310 RepID=A0A2X4U9V1_9NOCA|nr:serine hydrolase domain-containing protein [Rhodococcus coprophilus]MBM7459279.1 CubicO group peptidase (beta-lactamase class C family) [Rhodococcus coprophilus]SQI35721.1 putative esterase [Rhodococcus coprophilus]
MTQNEIPATQMVVDPRFMPVADLFFRMFFSPGQGGGALACYLDGECVLDIWAGWAARDRRWNRDTVALSFSTGKGVASTVVHRLADRGLVKYDSPVAEYWPEFAAAGKDTITVRELMSHRAGLHKARGLVPGRFGLLDSEAVAVALAAAPPDPRRTTGPGYHAVTYGNLVAEIAARASGTSFEELVRTEIAGPLGVDEFWYRVPQDQRHRIARVFPKVNFLPAPWATAGAVLARTPGLRGLAEAGMAEGFDELMRSPRAHDSVMPGWNGVFTARALARMYAAIAGGGMIDDVRLLEKDTVAQLLEVQTRRRDYVLGIRANWRLGYHPAWIALRQQPLRSVGHYGFGGSGAFADPDTGLSVAFVTNRMGNAFTTLSDGRFPRLGAAAVTAARRAA